TSCCLVGVVWYARERDNLPQDVQGKASPHASPGTGAGRGALALPLALQYRSGATDYRLATLPRVRLPFSAGSRVEGDSGRVPGLRRPSQSYLARRAGAFGSDLSGVLPPRPTRREGRLPALDGPGSLQLLHLQGVRQRRTIG